MSNQGGQGGQGVSDHRVNWEGYKKEVAKVIDTKVLKKGLGPALDALRDVVSSALEIKKVHGKLDERTLKPVRERKSAVTAKIDEYLAFCKEKAEDEALPQAKRTAWESLADKLDMMRSWPDNMTRAVLR